MVRSEKGNDRFSSPKVDSTYEYGVTYYLQAISTGANPTIECWSWGVKPDYYTEVGCKSPIPICLDEATSTRRQRFELPTQGTWSP